MVGLVIYQIDKPQDKGRKGKEIYKKSRGHRQLNTASQLNYSRIIFNGYPKNMPHKTD